MEKTVINATKRTVTGKNVGTLRRAGEIPGVIYGSHLEEPVAIQMNLREVTRAMATLTASSIVTLDVDGKEYPALIRERQRDYLKNKWIHIDFQAVSLKDKLRAKIEVVLVGVAPAIKNFNGMLIHEKESIEVEALPTDLPESIEADISVLENIGDIIHISDLKFGEGVTVIDDAEDTVVTIVAQAKEEAEEEVTTEASGSEPEVVEKGKKGEEGDED